MQTYRSSSPFAAKWFTKILCSYCVEILTFSMRTKGAALYITISTLAVAANTWVNPIALDAIAWK